MYVRVVHQFWEIFSTFIGYEFIQHFMTKISTKKFNDSVLLQSANILSNYLINENSIHEISLICTLALIAFEDQSFKTFILCYWAANTFGLFTFIRLSPIHWPYRLKCCICIHHYCMIWLCLPFNYVRYIVRLAINYIIY